MGTYVLDVPVMGMTLKQAGHLEIEPLCVFESEKRPEGGRPVGEVDRCIAKAVFQCAKWEEGSLFLGPDSRSGVCPGGQAWTGLGEMPDGIRYFVSTGSPNFRHGEAEYLKRNPELVARSKASVGRIRPPNGHLCVIPCARFREEAGTPLSLLLFAKAEQLRNLLALHHFGTQDAVASACAPWGPSCASFLTYPAGMAYNFPENSLVIGPVDPTGNEWMPPELMSLGMSMKVAERMVMDYHSSFLVKRPHVAFPSGR